MQINWHEISQHFILLSQWANSAIDWHEVQKAILAWSLLTWEHWLSKTEKVEAGSTWQLVKNLLKYAISRYVKKEAQDARPKI